jgi:heat shock protein HslJ
MRFVKGRLIARFGCNLMSAAYHRTGNLLHVGPLDSTRMRCSEAGAARERDAAHILGSLLTISWTSPDTLELTNRAGAIKLRRLG